MSKISEISEKQLKNIVKLKAMSNNDILLSTYNVPFYKPKNIYLDQIDISDNREIYANVNLNKLDFDLSLPVNGCVREERVCEGLVWRACLRRGLREEFGPKSFRTESG